MILPTKGIHPQDALISLGARLLSLLDEPKTVSRLWGEYKALDNATTVRFDWFMLSLDLLYIIGAVDMIRGRIERANPSRNLETQQ